jgi:hypothetical protein
MKPQHGGGLLTKVVARLNDGSIAGNVGLHGRRRANATCESAGRRNYCSTATVML